MLNGLVHLDLFSALSDSQTVVCAGHGQEFPGNALEDETLDAPRHGVYETEDFACCRVYLLGSVSIFRICTKVGRFPGAKPGRRARCATGTPSVFAAGCAAR